MERIPDERLRAANGLPDRNVHVRAATDELGRLLGHAALGVFADFLRDFHRTKVRATHRTEVSDLRAVGRQRFVVKRAGGIGIERQIELVFPAEFEASRGENVVPMARVRMSLRYVGRMRRDLVGDHAVFDVLLIR